MKVSSVLLCFLFLSLIVLSQVAIAAELTLQQCASTVGKKEGAIMTAQTRVNVATSRVKRYEKQLLAADATVAAAKKKSDDLAAESDSLTQLCAETPIDAKCSGLRRLTKKSNSAKRSYDLLVGHLPEKKARIQKTKTKYDKQLATVTASMNKLVDEFVAYVDTLGGCGFKENVETLTFEKPQAIGAQFKSGEAKVNVINVPTVTGQKADATSVAPAITVCPQVEIVEPARGDIPAKTITSKMFCPTNAGLAFAVQVPIRLATFDYTYIDGRFFISVNGNALGALSPMDLNGKTINKATITVTEWTQMEQTSDGQSVPRKKGKVTISGSFFEFGFGGDVSRFDNIEGSMKVQRAQVP